LVGGLPVVAEVGAYLIGLRTLPSDLRIWLIGGELREPGRIQLSVADYRTTSLHKMTEAMRDDLSEPWLSQYHDRGKRRWHHILWPRPRVR
jgi:hypothetical protein